MKFLALCVLLCVYLMETVHGAPQMGGTEFNKIGNSYGSVLDAISDAIRTTITGLVAPLAVPTTAAPRTIVVPSGPFVG